jgi:hypothetical protein
MPGPAGLLLMNEWRLGYFFKVRIYFTTSWI